MDAVQLSAIAGLILSLAFSYIPGLNTWFGALVAQQKQLIMGGLLIVIAAVIFGLGCAGLAPSGVTVECTTAGAYGFIQIVIAALVANQSTYLITK